MFRINAMGFEQKEAVGCLVDRPNGSGDFLFVHFLANAIANLSGDVFNVHPGACILFTPGHVQWYATPTWPFLNSYIHFDIDTSESFFEQLQIPLNQVFYPSDSTNIEVLIKSLQKEVILKDTYWESLSNGLMLQLFSYLGRLCTSKDIYHASSPKYVLFQKFKMARFEILGHSEHPWTLEEMAALTNLCVSRFCAYYKAFFNVSPKSDLIDTRIHKAKVLLTNEALTVNEVSEQLGYNNVFHFIRQFKSSTLVSPGKWRTHMNV